MTPADVSTDLAPTDGTRIGASWWVRFTGTQGQELHTRVIHPGIEAAVVIAQVMTDETDLRKPLIYFATASRGVEL